MEKAQKPVGSALLWSLIPAGVGGAILGTFALRKALQKQNDRQTRGGQNKNRRTNNSSNN